MGFLEGNLRRFPHRGGKVVLPRQERTRDLSNTLLPQDEAEMDPRRTEKGALDEVRILARLDLEKDQLLRLWPRHTTPSKAYGVG